MAYRHFGRSGDIWKHLPLAQILSLERPRTYIESNSAYASYSLSHTVELEYGVQRLWRKREKFPALAASKYVKLLSSFNKGGELKRYPGSPAQALALLEQWTDSFLFFDTDPEALASIKKYAARAGLSERVKLRNEESVEGVYRLLDFLDKKSLLFLDPYLVLEPNRQGHTYLDCFFRAVERGLPVVLWYGFMTTKEQRAVRGAIMEGMKKSHTSPTSLRAAELHLSALSDSPPPFNPGIAGCGLLMSGLRGSSYEAVERLGAVAQELYAEATYQGHDATQRFTTWLWEQPS